MTTWTLWIGALLVLTGSAALLTRRTGATAPSCTLWP